MHDVIDLKSATASRDRLRRAREALHARRITANCDRVKRMLLRFGRSSSGK